VIFRIVRFLLLTGLLCCESLAQSSNAQPIGLTEQPGVFLVHSDSSAVRLAFYTSDIVRIEFVSLASAPPSSSLVVVRDPLDRLPLSVLDTDSLLVCSTTTLRIQCSKHPLRITISDSTGRVLLAEASLKETAGKGGSRAITFRLHAADHFYGTGERGTALDKRGLIFESYNIQRGGYETPLPTMNINVPLLCSTNGYALYFDNFSRGTFDLGGTDSTTFSYTVAEGEIPVYVMAAPSIPGQLEKYTWLTGRQPLPPRWALGFIQSKNRYENETEVRSIARTIRERGFPCDAIVLDLAWFKYMGDLAWDTTAWPTHQKLVDDLLADGIKTVLITEPYIVQPSIGFAQAAGKGYLATDSTGKPFLLEHWWSCRGCAAALLDMTNPEARRWWWSRHPAAFGTSVAGVWTDLGEPERHPPEMRHHLGTAESIHNAYNLLWAQTIFDGFNTLRPGKRVFNLTRSGFAGIQRYGVLTWSGDVARSFGGISVQLPMLLNMGMSGIAYHGSDLGGYARMRTTPELYIRWMQFGMFSPTARAHGAGEIVHGYPTEPWMFGPEAERISREYIRLRYALLPYIYTLARENFVTGMPLARPLFFADPGNTRLLNDASSYLWGDAFLVSPVVEPGAREKTVYLPKGKWIDFWTDDVFTGGDSLRVSAPLDRMPLFVRAGSIIPMVPVMSHTDERQIDTLIIRVYPTTAAADSFTLYEDDGESLEYQHGAFALTTLSQTRIRSGNADELVLTVGKARGSFAGQVTSRTYLFEVHTIPKAPRQIIIGSATASSAKSLHQLRRTTEGFWFDSQHNIIYIQTQGSVDRQAEIRIKV
jgi:alpha-glucosidase (family GH31 glycosyl hydrolase)